MLFNSMFSRLRSRMERPWFGRLMFILLASFLWFLIKLSSSILTVEVSIPIELEEAPAGKILDSAHARKISVLVETQGYQYFNIRYSEFDPHVITYEGLKWTDKMTGIYLPNNYEEEFSNILGKNSHIIKFKPDTLKFNFLNKRSKRVPVDFRNSWTYFKAYRPLHQPQLNPDSITIYGPDRILDTLKKWPTTLSVLNNLNQDIKVDIPLATVHHEEIELSTNKVSVKQSVDLFTEISFTVDIKPNEVIEGLHFTPIQGQITLNVPFKQYNSYKAEQFHLIFGLSNTLNGVEALHISKLPEGAELLNYSPKTIQWWIQKP